MTKERANKVYDILVNMGGAYERMREHFIHLHCQDKDECKEYRFGGKLGFGGKYRSFENRVDCYSEDDTPARLDLIDQINLALKKI